MLKLTGFEGQRVYLSIQYIRAIMDMGPKKTNIWLGDDDSPFCVQETADEIWTAVSVMQGSCIPVDMPAKHPADATQ